LQEQEHRDDGRGGSLADGGGQGGRRRRRWRTNKRWEHHPAIEADLTIPARLLLPEIPFPAYPFLQDLVFCLAILIQNKKLDCLFDPEEAPRQQTSISVILISLPVPSDSPNESACRSYNKIFKLLEFIFGREKPSKESGLI
jgi:hypothetical protein